MIATKNDILERDGDEYLVIIADNEYFVIGLRYEDEQGQIITSFTDVEIYDNEFDTLEDLGFTIIGKVDSDNWS